MLPLISIVLGWPALPFIIAVIAACYVWPHRWWVWVPAFLCSNYGIAAVLGDYEWWWGVWQVPTHGAVIAAAFLLALPWAERSLPESVRPYSIGYAAAALIGGVVCGRLWFVVEFWFLFSDDYALIFDLHYGGAVLFGSVTGALLFMFIYSLWVGRRAHAAVELLHRSWRPWLDAIILPMLMVLAIGRIGCFANSCCYGAISSTGMAFGPAPIITHADDHRLQFTRIVPYIAFHEERVHGEKPSDTGSAALPKWQQTRLPVQLIAALVIAVLIGVVKLLPPRPPGQRTAVCLAGYAMWRFIAEYLRGDPWRWPGIGMSTSQVLSIALFVFALVLAWTSRQPPSSAPER